MAVIMDIYTTHIRHRFAYYGPIPVRIVAIKRKGGIRGVYQSRGIRVTLEVECADSCIKDLKVCRYQAGILNTVPSQSHDAYAGGHRIAAAIIARNIEDHCAGSGGLIKARNTTRTSAPRFINVEAGVVASLCEGIDVVNPRRKMQFRLAGYRDVAIISGWQVDIVT